MDKVIYKTERHPVYQLIPIFYLKNRVYNFYYLIKLNIY